MAPGMSFGVRLHVWGDRACFSRPEMKVERVSYDVITPSAARGILEAIHWKPAIRWVVDRLHVLRPIRFQSFRRNEVSSKIPGPTAERAMRAGSVAGLGMMMEEVRQQRAATLLVALGLTAMWQVPELWPIFFAKVPAAFAVIGFAAGAGGAAASSAASPMSV